MKKNCFNKIVNIFFLITAVLFASCSDLSIVDELDDTGTISISVAESNARMVLPTLDVEHFTDFELKGTLGSETQENIKTWSDFLKTPKEDYVQRRANDLSSYLEKRKELRNLEWYAKRLNFESVKIILGNKHNSNRYQSLVKSYIK